MAYVSRCSICSDLPTRKAVDAALAGGETPMSVFRVYGKTLHLSQASVYRHSRQHYGSGEYKTPRIQHHDGETTTGEMLADLAGLRRGLIEQYNAAVESGDSVTTARAAREAHAITRTLIDSNLPDGYALDVLSQWEHVMAAIQVATRTRPEFGLEYAAAARALKFVELADDVVLMVSKIRDGVHPSQKEKENA